MENAVFISLYDMGKALPDYEEIPIGLAMSDDVAREYEHIQKYFQALSRSDPQQASALQSAFINLLTAYPDQPYGHEPIFFSKRGCRPKWSMHLKMLSTLDACRKRTKRCWN